MRKYTILLFGVLLLTGCSNQTSQPKESLALESVKAEETTESGIKQEEGTVSLQDVSAVSEEETQEASGEIIEIRERMFVTQIMDVYYNTEDYLGKQLKWEGIYVEDTDTQTGEVYSSVIRYSPGCCGDDGVAGFEVLLPENQKPAIDDWVEVTGTLTTIEADGYQYLAVEVTNIQVLAERGEEFVSN